MFHEASCFPASPRPHRIVGLRSAINSWRTRKAATRERDARIAATIGRACVEIENLMDRVCDLGPENNQLFEPLIGTEQSVFHLEALANELAGYPASMGVSQ